MSCDDETVSSAGNDIKTANAIASAVNLLAMQLAKRTGVLLPAFFTSRITLLTQTGSTALSVSNDSGVTNIPFTEVPISGPVLAEVSKIAGVISATAAVFGGAAIMGFAGAVPVAFAVLAAGAAIKANKTMYDILTDASFYEELINDGAYSYLKEKTGLTPSELASIVFEGIMDGHIEEIRPKLKDVKCNFDNFTRYPQRSDPFTLDLDGDGLETVGVNATNPLLFDIDATGIKQSVGWVKPDDGFLALDRNGNGTIDSGAELFGDSTPLSTGGTAADGFAAVADLDSNGDGLVDAQDTAWTDLRVWQDTNQDGISDEGELKTLSEAGIASITVGKTEHLAVLANGNAIADLGSFTRSDGSEGTTGSVGQLADIDLAVDTFHSQFADTIPTTAATETLPDMGGSGQVRSLRQAASLDTAAGTALAAALAQYAGATTRAEQLSLLDGLLKAWSDTSAMATTFTGAYAGHELTVDMQSWYAGPTYNVGGADYLAWADKLTVMERFNGRTYQPVPDGTDPVALTLWHSPRDLLQLGYDALKQSVYDGLLLQTRLKPYMDAVGLTVSDAGIGMAGEKSRCWRDGERVCSNSGWRVVA